MTKIAIIGQGLAGTALALELKSRGANVVVFDNNHQDASSMVAAGMWNPIVFRRLTKSWNIDELLPKTLTFYSKHAEGLLESYEIARVFSSVHHQNEWSEREGEPVFSKYLSSRKLDEVDSAPIKAPFGYGVVENAGRVKLQEYLLAQKSCLQVRAEHVPYDSIVPNEKGACVGEEQFDHIIFCEGFKLLVNPWFNYLPLVPSKGEVFTIKCESLNTRSLINKGFFVLPLGKNLFRVGATFVNHTVELGVSEKGREWVKSKLENLLECDYTILEEESGIRPTTPDRRPFVGTHPKEKSLHVFNGFGSKGASLAPWCAEKFSEFILDAKVLPSEINIERYREKWSN